MRELERSSLRQADDADPPVGALAIVGAGRVGGSLAAAARAAGFEVRLAARGEATGACAGAEAALICVADADIAAAAEEVGAARPAPRQSGTSAARPRSTPSIPQSTPTGRSPSPCTRSRRFPATTPTSPAVHARSPAPMRPRSATRPRSPSGSACARSRSTRTLAPPKQYATCVRRGASAMAIADQLLTGKPARPDARREDQQRERERLRGEHETELPGRPVELVEDGEGERHREQRVADERARPARPAAAGAGGSGGRAARRRCGRRHRRRRLWHAGLRGQ